MSFPQPARSSRKPKAVRSRILKFRATPEEEKKLLRLATRAGRTLTKFVREKVGLAP